MALDAPRIEHFFGDVSGSLQASGRLTGAWENPQGNVSAKASAVRLPHGMALRSVAAKASGSLGSHVAEVSVQADGVELDARLRGGWKAQAGWSGEVQALRNRALPLSYAPRCPCGWRRSVPSSGASTLRSATDACW